MDVDLDSSHPGSERGELDSSVLAPGSSNGSGGEEDEVEAGGRVGGGGCGSQHGGDGGGLCGGREQEVSVEIGETYLCQRADKTWRKLKLSRRQIVAQHHRHDAIPIRYR